MENRGEGAHQEKQNKEFTFLYKRTRPRVWLIMVEAFILIEKSTPLGAHHVRVGLQWGNAAYAAWFATKSRVADSLRAGVGQLTDG